VVVECAVRRGRMRRWRTEESMGREVQRGAEEGNGWVGREGSGAGQLRCRCPENARGEGQTAKCRCFCSNCWTAHSSDC
jgi:hypothetical protein